MKPSQVPVSRNRRCAEARNFTVIRHVYYFRAAHHLSGLPRRCCRDCSGMSVILLAAGMVLEGFR